jgi:hypothetical protein
MVADTRLSLNSSSPETWAMVSDRLADCVSNHPQCIEDCDPDWLPTRLIDVGSPCSQQNPRLVITSELSSTKRGQTPRYLALSHIWGKSAFLRLTSANIEQLKRCIPTVGLSQTFRDAIVVSHRVGVHYLWIDSLCIQQDSLEDWRIESAMMGSVYKNSLLTIAASEAIAPDQGLFKERETQLFTPFKLSFYIGSYKHQAVCNYDPWNLVCMGSPLSQRGWATQERLLSSRTVHFATPTFWECREVVACEVYPIGRKYGDGHMLNKIWSLSPSMSEEDRVLSHWESTVATYSCGKLTRSEDKLVAVSGIAKLFASMLQDDYLAGLWRRSLLRGLMWGVQQHGRNVHEAERVPVYRGTNRPIMGSGYYAD